MDIDKFIMEESVNGTLFHTEKFLSYHGDKFVNVKHFLEDGDKKIIFISAIDKDGFLNSHPGSSYGGPVFSSKCTYDDLCGFIASLKKDCRDKHLNGIKMRLPPRVFHSGLSEDLDFALIKSGFKVTYELSSAISLFDKIPYASSAKRSYNKAISNGLYFKIIYSIDDHKIFYSNLCHNLSMHDAYPTHTEKELISLSDLFFWKIFLYKVCNLRGEMIAGSMVLECNKIAAHTFYLWQDYNYQIYRPMNLLIFRLAEIYKAKGFKYLNLGISTEDNGLSLNRGLLRFKESFGARGVLRKTFKWEGSE